ncbi:MAG: tail fiber protein, partial [Candidatus Cloacimonetes bacterium]|nr:tail fiber protein [Candidatus Cloacimonadota bacterium]
RGFAASFAPKNWAYCDGQLLDIAQYGALFSLLGTHFGGDGIRNFALPNLQGRTLIHKGISMGGTPKIFGEMGGYERVTLDKVQMPMHTHTATTQGGSGSLSGTATASMHVNNDSGGTSTPANNFLGLDENDNTFYATTKDDTHTLNPQAITVNTSGLSVDVTGISVAIDNAGESRSHSNMQPYLVISWIICCEGLYPQRQ